MNIESILDYEWVVHSVINKFNSHNDYEDLYQVGMMALTKAYHNYRKEGDAKIDDWIRR